MEIRNATISFTKYKAKVSRDRAEEIRQQLEQLDDTICNNFFSPDINQILLHYDNLKSELNLYMKIKGGKRCSERNVVGWNRVNALQNIF